MCLSAYEPCISEILTLPIVLHMLIVFHMLVDWQFSQETNNLKVPFI